MAFFFTADTHFSHKAIIHYCKRPFDSTKEMDDYMIWRWNSVVGKKDTVYHLGDFALCDKKKIEKIVNKLNGKIIICMGSHDRLSALNKFPNKIVDVRDVALLKAKGFNIFMSHYCHRVWPLSHYNTFHCHGHSHCKLDTNGMGKIIDVGVDCHGYTPWSLDEIVEEMKNKPDNLNLV